MELTMKTGYCLLALTRGMLAFGAEASAELFEHSGAGVEIDIPDSITIKPWPGRWPKPNPLDDAAEEALDNA